METDGMKFFRRHDGSYASSAENKGVKAYPNEVTVTSSGALVVNPTELLKTPAAKRQIDALRSLEQASKNK